MSFAKWFIPTRSVKSTKLNLFPSNYIEAVWSENVEKTTVALIHKTSSCFATFLFIFLFIQSVRLAARIVQLTRRVFRCMDQVETWNMQWNALWQLFAHFIPIYNPSVVYMLSHHEAFLKKIVQYSYLWSISSECIYWPVSLVQVVQSRGTRPPN